MFAETETVVLICFLYFDSFTLVSDNQKRVDDEWAAKKQSPSHNADRSRRIKEALREVLLHDEHVVKV